MVGRVAVKRKAAASIKSSGQKKVKLVASSFEFYDLNDDCLIGVFKTFDTLTLAKMARSCTRFHSLITTHIIPFRTIDFSTFRKWASIRNVFVLFGESMTHIVVHQDDIQTVFPGYSRFAEFLRLLVEFGQKGKLKRVNLTFGGWRCDVPDKLMQDVAPYFANVQELEFDFTEHSMPSGDFSNFLMQLRSSNLREIRFHNIHSLGKWFSPELFTSAEKIHLCLSHESRRHFWHQQFHHDRNAFNESRLIHFLAHKPGLLIDFECINAPSDGIFVALSLQYPKIERLSEIKCWPTNTVANNNNNNGGAAAAAPMNRFQRDYGYFNAFTNLKEVCMKSATGNFSDLGKMFSILAKRQTIEQLKLNLGSSLSDQGNPVNTADLKRLTQLKTLNLSNFDDKRSKEFVNTLFANLPALTTCTIDGKHPKQGRIIELIKLAPNLKVLKFNGKFKSLSASFYKKLAKCREPPDGQDASEKTRLVIHVDRKSAQNCLEKLGVKRYKPSIVMIRSI